MKNLITCLALLITAVGFSQSKNTNGIVVKETTKIENVSVTVTVDSAEDIESTFNIDDIDEIIDKAGDDETLSFKIICNGDRMSNGKKSHVSYKVDGNTSDKEGFKKSVEVIREAAIKYYNNKN